MLLAPYAGPPSKRPEIANATATQVLSVAAFTKWRFRMKSIGILLRVAQINGANCHNNQVSRSRALELPPTDAHAAYTGRTTAWSRARQRYPVAATAPARLGKKGLEMLAAPRSSGAHPEYTLQFHPTMLGPFSAKSMVCAPSRVRTLRRPRSRTPAGW